MPKPIRDETRSTLRVMLRYAAFQIPELMIVGCVLGVAHAWWELSAGTAGMVAALWIAKDVAMFPITRVAYAPHDGRLPRDLHGSLGIAHDGLDEEAYVRIGPELWRARRADHSLPVAPGGPIRVIAQEGLTVVVEGHLEDEDR